MFSIAICDDEVLICQQVEKALSRYIDRNIAEAAIFYSGEKLCQDLSSGKRYDLIFLDIQLENMDGISVGNYIRKDLQNETTHIVYISTKSDYAMDLFGVRPLNYLIKPLKEEDICMCVDKAISLSSYFDDYFKFKSSNNMYSIPYGDIMFFSTSGRKIEIHTKTKNYSLYGKLDSVIEQIAPTFIRVHKSFLVNEMYIKEWGYERLVLTNDIVIPISQSYRSEVRRILQKKWKDG